jgi:predicted HicB family RNase H-like nuclease
MAKFKKVPSEIKSVKNYKVTMTTRVSEEVHKALDRAASEGGITRSRLMENILVEWIDWYRESKKR